MRSDLRKRVESAEGSLAEQASEQGVTRAALSVLREREASLQGTVLRKEGLLRELRERLEGVQQVGTQTRKTKTATQIFIYNTQHLCKAFWLANSRGLTYSMCGACAVWGGSPMGSWVVAVHAYLCKDGVTFANTLYVEKPLFLLWRHYMVPVQQHVCNVTVRVFSTPTCTRVASDAHRGSSSSGSGPRNRPAERFPLLCLPFTAS